MPTKGNRLLQRLMPKGTNQIEMLLGKHPIVSAKIGTHSSTRIVLWKPYKDGDKRVLAMELSQWENSHWSYRRLKTCNFWKTYFIDKVSPEGFMYLYH